ncbi:aldehyde dehydrogenase family protein [Marinobacterium sp. D7]|uniref:aldehyde dehydrogenase family protein n=1 Tax=Marinobacterium ramblicola TaxID=2849041 RepID=UPI001C2DB387|nr:aldehyde dehydrogenase family protein [Marinobacterium ramblicola]MBV1788477.1 aldehyde dehydrogenase family protein [Marinobacterium ramblicola]
MSPDDQIPNGTDVPIRQLFDAQRETALRLRTSSADERRRKLKRLNDALLGRREALYEAFQTDFRKPAAEVELSELLPVVDEIHMARHELGRWMKPKSVGSTLATFGTRASLTYQSKGRCLIIGPWNYPVSTLIGPLVSAIAAGNTVILKPSEFTPAVNAVLADLIAEVFDVTEVAWVEGDATTAQALLDCPFDHIFFTGSPQVGKLVMAAASRHLASVTLELGGKSPVIVDESTDLQRAAEVIIWGKLINAGQSCIAPDTLFVQRSVRDKLMQHCKEIIARRYGTRDTDIADSPDFSRIINTRHAGRIAALVDEALELGAKRIAGGPHDVDGCFVAPTLLTDIPDSARILEEEIFGPVLPVIEFEQVDDVIAYVNARPKPLALYLWSTRQATIRQIRDNTSSGSFVLNHCMLQYAHSRLPFGGVNNSGIGSSHGIYGFKAFSHERACLRGGPVLVVKTFFPPYTPVKRKLIGSLIQWLCRF